MLTVLHKNQPFPTEFPKGIVLLIDKPAGWTSFDAVNKVRYMFGKKLGTKKLKVGHAGTLDPLANGLLIICIGEYTRKIDQLQGLPKGYEGIITFGATTPSYDLEKPMDATFPTDQLSDAFLASLLPQFTGTIEQIPPIFSAVKVDGRRLYRNARTGQEVEIAARSVEVSKFELSPLRPVPTPVQEHFIHNSKGNDIHLYPDYEAGLQADFRVECSKGTYIRSLVHDLGQAAGSGAYLSSLRRTDIGEYSVEDAWEIGELAAFVRDEL